MQLHDSCFCGSGQRFKRCCGSNAPDRPAPHGIVVIEDFLSARQCAELIEIANQSSHEPLTTVDINATTAEEVVRKPHDGRVTDRVDMGKYQNRLDGIIRDALLQRIATDIDDEFAWYEQPQLLRYSAGGYYHLHADSENLIEAESQWRRDLDRDISLLVYLNEEFEGGNILFANFGYRLQPRPGMLVYFPSDHRYLHAAEEITAGVRYAIVSWAALKGVDKVRSEPPEDAILLD